MTEEPVNEAVTMKRMTEIINSISETTNLVEEVNKLLNTYMRFPIKFPIMRNTTHARRFMEILSDRLGSEEFGDVVILSRELKPMKIKPRVRLGTYYFPTNGGNKEVLVLKVVNDSEFMGDIIIPLACMEKECTVEMTFLDILRIVSLFAWNEEFVRKIIEAISDTNKAIAKTLNDLSNRLVALQIIGFEKTQ